MVPKPLARVAVSVRKRAGQVFTESFFKGIARSFSVTPLAWPRLYGVEVIRDVPYLPGGLVEQRLDIYRPRHQGNAPRPALMYVHGGGFRFMAKETHWLMGLLFASRGYVVFNVEYRLAPRYRFPAAHQDVAAAYQWMIEHRGEYGSAGPIVLAGESAGANLAWGVTLSACYERPEPWARQVFDLGVVPDALVSACGMLEVSHPERVLEQGLSTFFLDRFEEVYRDYVAGSEAEQQGKADLVDPLVVLEQGFAPRRPLPAVVATVGTADPLLDDTRRLQVALERLAVPVAAWYYPGEIHSFQPLIWRRHARRSWAATFRFLEDQVGIRPEATGSRLASVLLDTPT